MYAICFSIVKAFLPLLPISGLILAQGEGIGQMTRINLVLLFWVRAVHR